MRILSGFVALFPSSLNIVQASSDPIFFDYRTVGPEGRFYAVVRRRPAPLHEEASGPVEIILAECREGSPPIRKARGKTVEINNPNAFLGVEYIVKATVGVRDGDRILCRLELEDAPWKLLICPQASAFVCMDEHGMNFKIEGGEPAMVSYSFEGEKLFSKRLTDLFTEEEVERFWTSTAGIYWFRDAWVNQANKDVVFVTATEKHLIDNHGLPLGKAIRVLDVREGKMRLGGEDEVLRAIKVETKHGLKTAIQLAGEMRLKNAVPSLKKLLQSPKPAIRSNAQKAIKMIRKKVPPENR